MISIARRLQTLQSVSPTFLTSPDSLRAVIDRERMRSDRNGQSLSLITLALSDEDSTRNSYNIIATLLADRLRTTDASGMLAPRLVGVLLPDTARPGALKVVHDLRPLLESHGLKPQFTLFEHPWNEQDSSNGNGKHSDDGTVQEQPEAAAVPTHDLQELLSEPLPAWKRATDIAGALVALALLSPLLFLVALAIKVSSRGPVFFAQQRTGLGGKRFTMWKFRSMCQDAEAVKRDLLTFNEQDGPAFKLSDDPRITTLGRIIRRTSIDELPQLWNVLWGDMSLVGPRPLPCDEAERCLRWQKRRLHVTPGITCLWQVTGRSRESFAHWVRLDLAYARKRTLWNDIKLLLRTVPAVLSCRGAS